jgi:membrane associated rhomboid family serine protease
VTVVYAIIALNVVVSLYGFRALGRGEPDASRFVFVPHDVARGENGLGMLLSHVAHVNVLHLGFNMLALWSFSSTVLEAVGPVWYFVIYAAAGFGSDLVVFAFRRDDPTYKCLGASGSVSGIMMAAVVLDPSTSIAFVFAPVPIPGPFFMIGYVLVSVILIMRRARGGISHEGHLGGALVGLGVTVLVAPRGLAPLIRWFGHWL